MAAREIIISAVVAAAVSVATTYAVNRADILRPAVEVPTIAGFALETAQALIEARGLQIAVAEQRIDPRTAPGRVIPQSPFAGSKLNYGAMVQVVVAKAPTTVKTPALIGQPLSDAKAHLEAAQLMVGQITEEVKANAVAGSVIGQSVAADIEVKVGAAINLVVAKAVETVAVPRVVGRLVSGAKKELVKAGFTVGKITYRSDDEEEEGIVLAQTPAAESQAPKGSEVTLVVNTY
jgi:eukaryotic-like serine/threonine-protein kinase